MKKIQIYRMPMSRVFPATHPKKGEKTFFENKIKKALGFPFECEYSPTKHHTCRQNLQGWKKRIKEVNTGDAVLVVYEWLGKPYRSKTRTLIIFGTKRVWNFIMNLKKSQLYANALIITDEKPLEVDKLTFISSATAQIDSGEKFIDLPIELIAANDGLSVKDYKDWFKKIEPNDSLAVIYFTKFRY